MNPYAKPGPKDTISVGMLRSCDFCEAMVHADRRQRHLDWHRMNGLHAPDCVLLLLGNMLANAGEPPPLQDCTCGLVPRTTQRAARTPLPGMPERPRLSPPERYEDI